MFIKHLTVGPIGTNCYILCDTASSAAAVIDPGAEAERILSALGDTGCRAEYILLTHAHWDHTGAVAELKEKTGARFAVFAPEEPLLCDDSRNFSRKFGAQDSVPRPDILISDGGTLRLGGLKLKFIATPGHTAGSCCIICGDCIFTGDTVFREDVGRTDLPTGSEEDIVSSVKKLAALEGEYRLFPGHGELTTMSHERAFNPLLGGGAQ
jgi:hydroxyacylglutathione hydrolase